MRKLSLAMIFCLMSSGCAAPTANLRVTKEYHANATWYQCCKKTASGEKFNPDGYTVAHKKYPFGKILRLTNMENGKYIIVRVNDRGPFTKGVDLDISRGGARELGIIDKGRAKVRVEHIESR